MSGRFGDLSKDQKAALEKLKENTKDIRTEKHDDRHLLRFLRARNFNVKKSEEMFRKNVEFRIVNKMDTILQDYKLPEAVDKYYCGGFSGVDKEGHLVDIEPIGNIDPRGIVYSIKSSERTKVCMYLMEEVYQEIKQNSKLQGRYIEGMVSIIDLEGLGAHFLWKPFISLWNEMMEIMEQYYPETVKKIIIINAPSIFPLAYSLVRPFLHEGTRKKIKVVKNKNIKSYLLKHIEADQLPVNWGGTKTDPDGNTKCLSKIRCGGKVPEKYYLKDQLLDDDSLTKISIGKGASKELKYIVHVPESGIRYTFKTDEGEIIFSIHRPGENKGSKKVVIKEAEKMICHVTIADGEVEAKDAGEYIFRFENHSKLKSKTLSYQIEVLEPDDDTLESEELLQPRE